MRWDQDSRHTRYRACPADVRGEDTTAASIAESFDDLTRDLRLYVDYDEPSLDQLFALIASAAEPPVRRLVRRGEAAIGWYAYLPRPGGASRVLHLCGRDSEMERRSSASLSMTLVRAAAPFSQAA